jgi:hypothetical protein
MNEASLTKLTGYGINKKQTDLNQNNSVNPRPTLLS